MTRMLALVLVVSAVAAQAQSAADEPGYALVMATTAAPALLFDVLIAKNLFEDGTVRKGFAINAAIFGGVATTLGAILASTFWGDTRVKPIWVPLAFSLAAIGLGTVMMGIWGLLHQRGAVAPAADPLPSDPDPGPFTPPPPPLPEEIPLLRLMPLLGVSERGAMLFGVSGSL
jgi:hypothetical protein